MLSKEQLTNRLKEGVATLHLGIPPLTQEAIIDFLYFLEKWNKSYNLTAISELDKMLSHHILDSLAISPYIQGLQVLDVGTGAGFPGIPLAFYFTQKHFTLLDSNGKKTRFLMQAKTQFKLTNTTIVQSRAEDYQSSIHFDVITARAVSSIIDLVKHTCHLLSPGGQWVLMKGLYPQQELHELELTKPELLVNAHRLNVPGLSAARHCIIITKP